MRKTREGVEFEVVEFADFWWLVSYAYMQIDRTGILGKIKRKKRNQSLEGECDWGAAPTRCELNITVWLTCAAVRRAPHPSKISK
jgi:hypothetical protein